MRVLFAGFPEVVSPCGELTGLASNSVCLTLGIYIWYGWRQSCGYLLWVPFKETTSDIDEISLPATTSAQALHIAVAELHSKENILSVHCVLVIQRKVTSGRPFIVGPEVLWWSCIYLAWFHDGRPFSMLSYAHHFMVQTLQMDQNNLIIYESSVLPGVNRHGTCTQLTRLVNEKMGKTTRQYQQFTPVSMTHNLK